MAKLVFRQSNIVCIEILFLLIVKTNSLSGRDSYVTVCFFNVCGYKNVCGHFFDG